MAEMALAVVLLVGAGLLIRSFSKLLAVDPGFRAERVVTFNIAAPDAKYGQYAQRRALVTDLVERMKRVPGAQGAAIVTGLPLSNMMMRTSAHIVGTPPTEAVRAQITDVAMVDAELLLDDGHSDRRRSRLLRTAMAAARRSCRS